MADDATPPLVAASPVPPVVPDSEALSSLPTSMLRPDDGAWYDKDDPDDNPPQVVPELLALAQRIRGSGVVPDKPALALCAQHGGIGYCSPLCPNASVPAVTDDEAATEAIRTHFRQVKPTTYREMANEALIALRSAGFLIVHHTKET